MKKNSLSTKDDQGKISNILSVRNEEPKLMINFIINKGEL